MRSWRVKGTTLLCLLIFERLIDGQVLFLERAWASGVDFHVIQSEQMGGLPTLQTPRKSTRRKSTLVDKLQKLMRTTSTISRCISEDLYLLCRRSSFQFGEYLYSLLGRCYYMPHTYTIFLRRFRLLYLCISCIDHFSFIFSRVVVCH